MVTLLGQEVKHHNVISQAIYFKDLYWSLKQKEVLSESVLVAPEQKGELQRGCEPVSASVLSSSQKE